MRTRRSCLMIFLAQGKRPVRVQSIISTSKLKFVTELKYGKKKTIKAKSSEKTQPASNGAHSIAVKAESTTDSASNSPAVLSPPLSPEARPKSPFKANGSLAPPSVTDSESVASMSDNETGSQAGTPSKRKVVSNIWALVLEPCSHFFHRLRRGRNGSSSVHIPLIFMYLKLSFPLSLSIVPNVSALRLTVGGCLLTFIMESLQKYRFMSQTNGKE